MQEHPLRKSSTFACASSFNQASPYILIEGLPGGGKSTAIELIVNKTKGFVVVDDICNPCLYAQNYRMDWEWVVLAESMKSQLATRAEGIGLMERGYLSLLAFHAAEDVLMGTNRCRDVALSLLASKCDGLFIPPIATIVLDINPECSGARKNRTRMNEWRNTSRLARIQQFYRIYAELPIFNERYILIDATGNQSATVKSIMEFINAVKPN